jgi:hypothetical protein
MAYGKRAAQAIDEQLMDAKRWEQLYRPMKYEQTAPKTTSESRRHHSRDVSADQRAKTFEEVVVGLSAEDAHDECCRCLRCDVSVTVAR